MFRTIVFMFLFALAFLPGTVTAQHTTQPLQITYALVEITHGSNPYVSITLEKGLPPANAATHMFGVATVNFLKYNDNDGPLVKNASTAHLFRYYVLGVPNQLRVSDLVAGTVTSIRIGDPPLVLPGQNSNCGILFPDAHFIGCLGDSYSGWLISATLGQYQKFTGKDGGYGQGGFTETSVGLMPQGRLYQYGSDPNFQGHASYGGWASAVSGPQTARLHITYLYGSSGLQVTGGSAGQVLLRYVIGY